MTNQVKVGIFALVTIVIFVVGFYFLKGIDLFERKNSYYAIYERVDNLYKSSLVEINGYPVGRVGDMKRNHENGQIVVRLDLEKDFRIPKSDSTTAVLISTDFLGTKKIKLVFGRSAEFYDDGDTINTYFKKDLTEQLGGQIDPIMSDVQRLVPTLDSTVFAIKQLFNENNPKSVYTTLGEVNVALAKINLILAANEMTIKAALKNLESITGNIEKNNAGITRIINNAASITDTIQQANLKQTIGNLNNTIGELKGLLNEVNSGKGTLGKIVKSEQLYTHVDSAVNSLNVLLKDVKARPYRYINISVLGSKKHDNMMEKKYNESGK